MTLYAGTVNSVTSNPLNGNVDVTMTFQNGGRTVTRTVSAADLDDIRIKNLMLAIAEQLEAQDTAQSAITTGAITFR